MSDAVPMTIRSLAPWFGGNAREWAGVRSAPTRLRDQGDAGVWWCVGVRTGERTMNDKQKELALEAAVLAVRWLASNDNAEVSRIYAEAKAIVSALDAAADAPKRKYTVKDIEKPKKGDGDSPLYRIYCGRFGWTDKGWSEGMYSVHMQQTADMIYAGLVATGNVPEVGE